MVDDFTDEEIIEMARLVRNRLNYESRRPARYNQNGKDWQSEKTWILSSILDKLEARRLAQ